MLLPQLRAMGIKYLRNGWTFQRLLRRLQQTQYLGREELAAYQNARLQAMVHHCYRHVPYYRDMFRQLKLSPEAIRTPDDLKRLPYIDKRTVMDNFDRFLSRKGWLSFPGYTSGSTGMPGKFLRDYHFINFENAAIWRHFRMHGYMDTRMRRVVFTGRLIVPVDQEEPPFWFHSKLDNTLVLSSLHLSPQNMRAYIDAVKEFRPEVMAGYPSAMAALAEGFERHRERLPIKVVFPGSETVFDYQRDLIERVFETDIYDWYGQQERVSAIGQCEFKNYHVIEDYSITELVELDGHIEVVGTHLENYKMPLLRYRTGDTVLPSHIDCPCGRYSRTVERVLGRMGQYILTPDGRKITVVNYMFQQFENIREAQFVQDRPDAVTLLLVTADGFSEENMRHVIETARSFISPVMEINVRIVDTIPRGANGKFLSVVNNLAMAGVG